MNGNFTIFSENCLVTAAAQYGVVLFWRKKRKQNNAADKFCLDFLQALFEAQMNAKLIPRNERYKIGEKNTDNSWFWKWVFTRFYLPIYHSASGA